VPDAVLQKLADSGIVLRERRPPANLYKAWTGNSCEVLEMDAAELEAAIERDDCLIRDLRDQAIVLAGDDARIVLERKVTR
jgi:hypothetical protein